MSDEPTEAEAEAAVQEILDQLLRHTPLKAFVDMECALRCKNWIRRLSAHPAALAEFSPLVLDETGRPRYSLRPDQIDRIMACIERHPALKSIVDREWRLFHAHNLRMVLFRDLPAPKVKSKEWKKIYEKLEKILAAVGKDDFHLIMDEVEEPGHKIEVQNPDVLTPRLIEQIQAALKGWKNIWYVILQLDVDSLGLDIEPFCWVVWADHVDDMGDRKRLKALLGPRFRL